VALSRVVMVGQRSRSTGMGSRRLIARDEGGSSRGRGGASPLSDPRLIPELG